MKATDFLAQVSHVIRERGGQYGDMEDNMADIARRWSGVIGAPVTAKQVTLMMIELKLSRLRAGMSLDSVTDIAGYAAILAELATEG